MFYGGTVQDTRQLFFLSWKKYQQKQALEPLEQQIVDVIIMHPEYHDQMAASVTSNHTYFPELGQSNPFLHMGLHLAIRDQIATNRPAGITAIYQQLHKKHADTEKVEHLLMEQLATCLWQAQRDHTAPDEKSYVQACGALLGKALD